MPPADKLVGCLPGSTAFAVAGLGCIIWLLGCPHFFFLQAAMEPFYVTVALRMIIGGAPMGDPQPIQSFHKAGQSELCSVVGGEGHEGIPAAFWQTRKHGLFDGIEGFFRPTTMRQIPTYDFPGAAVHHTHQVRPAHGRTRPDLGHVRLPDLIWFSGFHAAPLLSCDVPEDDANALATPVHASRAIPVCDSS
jgi:hypothetical protein